MVRKGAESSEEQPAEEGTGAKSNESADREGQQDWWQSRLATVVRAAETKPISRECQLQKIKSFKKPTRRENHESLR